MRTSSDASATEPEGGAAGPADAGWRWPAEWEPHEATWLSWPHNPETWPGCLAAAEDAFVAMVAGLAPHESVWINVRDEAAEARVRARLAGAGVDVERDVRFFAIPTDDAWLRDCGPVFLTRPGERAIADFGFDAWGRKYPPWDRDDAVPRRAAEALGARRFAADFVLEAGSVDGDGAGSVLTTESCLLHPNREPGRTREQMEARLSAWLGAERVIWLREGIAGDDTDGHVDDFARWVAPERAVCVAGVGDAAARLRAAGLEVVELPAPDPVLRDGETLPASYANFLLANDVAIVPVFQRPQDARALAILHELLEGREIVPIDARSLVVGLGGVHCLTQQVPVVPPRSGGA